jgi:ABC-type nickel/cobalt efflux system permease component RcnA
LGSGILVAMLGARALAAEMRRRRPIAHVHVHVHDHAHPHAHDHAHGLGVEEHDHAFLTDEAHARAHAPSGTAPLTFRTAVMAAASGNLAPCPAALVVLLAAIALHRIALGMALIVAFSIGLAATLTVLGLAVVRGAAWLSGRPQFASLARWAPFASAAAIALVGAVMVGEGLVAQGVPAPAPVVAALTFAAIIGYAFALPHGPVGARTQHV